MTTFVHEQGRYGHDVGVPDSNMSLNSVSIGVFPTSRTKKSCSTTDELILLSEGSLSNNLPNRVGWLGYWFLEYSSKAHWVFSCRLSMYVGSVNPDASKGKTQNIYQFV